MSEKDLKCKRIKVLGANLIAIIILLFVFVLNSGTRNYTSFFGYSSLAMFITLLIADVWLKETSLEAFDMPSIHLCDSPINVAIQPFFFICFIAFCILKARSMILFN